MPWSTAFDRNGGCASLGVGSRASPIRAVRAPCKPPAAQPAAAATRGGSGSPSTSSTWKRHGGGGEIDLWSCTEPLWRAGGPGTGNVYEGLPLPRCIVSRTALHSTT